MQSRDTRLRLAEDWLAIPRFKAAANPSHLYGMLAAVQGLRTLNLRNKNHATKYSHDAAIVASISHVLLIAECFVPARTSIAKLVKDLADELARRGLAVTILVPSPFIDEPCQVSTEDGLEVIRIRTGKIKGANKVVRGFVKLASPGRCGGGRGQSFPDAHLISLFLSHRQSSSVLWLSSSRNYSVGPAYLVLRDLWTQFMLDVGELRPGLTHKCLLRFERQQYSAANVIGVQTPGDLTCFGHDHLGIATCRSPVQLVLYRS